MNHEKRQRASGRNLVDGSEHGTARIDEVVGDAGGGGGRARGKVQGGPGGISLCVRGDDAPLEERHRGVLGDALDRDQRGPCRRAAAIDLDRIFERAKGRFHAARGFFAGSSFFLFLFLFFQTATNAAMSGGLFLAVPLSFRDPRLSFVCAWPESQNCHLCQRRAYRVFYIACPIVVTKKGNQ